MSTDDDVRARIEALVAAPSALDAIRADTERLGIQPLPRFHHVSPSGAHDFFHAYRIEELLLKKEWSPLPSTDESLA